VTWDDVDDEWTEAILAAHPVHSGAHDEWVVAMQMVGHRRSKYELVMLVNWLLVERARARRAAAEPKLDTRRLDATCRAAWELVLEPLGCEITPVADPQRTVLWPGSPEIVATLLREQGFSPQTMQMPDGREFIVIYEPTQRRGSRP
jgi:hypothetical protein